MINVPDHTYIPEEYVPDADERVLFYRKLASADTIEFVDELVAGSWACMAKCRQLRLTNSRKRV